MKRAAFMLFLGLLLVAGHAYAFDTPLTDAAQRSLLETTAKANQHLADELGCKQFAWGNIDVKKDSTTYTLKYLPEGADMKSWTKMTVVTVYNLPGDAASARVFMAKTIAMLEGSYKKFAIVTNDLKYTDEHGDPLLFFEYSMGKGDAAVYVSSSFMRADNNTAAFVQFETRGAPVPTEISTQIREKVFLEAK